MNKFSGARILIVGDVMLDRYFWGTVSRISPEAPVPVVKLERQTLTAGGAANVAANVSSLGANAFLIGAVGADNGGRELAGILEKNNVSSEYLVKIENRPTTAKTRIVAHHQHVVRLDDEIAAPLEDEEAEEIYQAAIKLLPQIDVLVLSDYAKGCLCEAVLFKIIRAARDCKIPILVDPKGKNYRKYNGATVLTPNKFEAAAASGVDINDEKSLSEAGAKLLSDLEIDSLLVTLGEDGMLLFEKNGESQQFPAAARDVYDVTGAGDTVIAALAGAIGAGADLATAAQIANTAAGIAVEQVGTATVTLDELEKSLEGMQTGAGEPK